MVADGIMTAVQGIIDRFSMPEQKIAGEIILKMLGDFDEVHWYTMDDKETDEWLFSYLDDNKEETRVNIIDIKDTSQTIAEILEHCSFDDITDSSGYYVIKKFEDGTDRAVDVYKSTGDGTEPPHYAIYISYEDDSSDCEYTDGLSVEELEKKLEELSQ